MPSNSAEDCCRACLNNPAVICCVNTFRWVPVIFIVAVVVWSYYAYVIELCILTIDNYFEKIVYIVLYHVFLLLFLWAYYQTIFATIGAPSENFVLPRSVVDELKQAPRPSDHRLILDKFTREKNLPVTMRAFDGAIRYCEKCTCVKPDRSHHCSVCGQCVLKFDHHCPWVNTCVNYRNYKFFIQFLGYALLFCIYVFLTDIQYFIWFWTTGLKHGGASKFHIMFMFFVSGMFSISVSALFFYHLWLSGKNRSTIESFRAPVFTYGPDADGFSLGWRENFKEVFGTNRCLWFLPIFSSRGDGCAYGTPNLHNRPPSAGDSRNAVEDGPELRGNQETSDREPTPHNQEHYDGKTHNERGSPNEAFWTDETRTNNHQNNERAMPLSNGGGGSVGSYWSNDQTNITGANYQTFSSRGDGIVYPMPMIDPEVDTLLNTRHPKWEDDEDSASSDYDNHQVSFGPGRSVYNPGNNNSILREEAIVMDQGIPMANVPVILTRS